MPRPLEMKRILYTCTAVDTFQGIYMIVDILIDEMQLKQNWVCTILGNSIVFEVAIKILWSTLKIVYIPFLFDVCRTSY